MSDIEFFQMQDKRKEEEQAKLVELNNRILTLEENLLESRNLIEEQAKEHAKDKLYFQNKIVELQQISIEKGKKCKKTKED